MILIILLLVGAAVLSVAAAGTSRWRESAISATGVAALLAGVLSLGMLA